MASADPLLTSCCSVCRANPPRYKCPRCNIPYCSVECNRRHRARAGCSGIRDVTTFVPRARLCTAAGIDRDYNFLQGIDVARTSAVKHVVDERHVLRPNDVVARVINEEDPNEDKNKHHNKHHHNKYGKNNNHQNKYNKNHKGPHKNQQRPHNGPALVKHWAGEEVVYLPARPKLTGAAAAMAAEAAAAAAAAREKNDDDDDDDDAAADEAFPTLKFDTFLSTPTTPTYESATSIRVRGMCRRDNIELLGAPRGFARQRENNTTVATETVTTKGGGKVSNVHLHWQVEWLAYTTTVGDSEATNTPMRVHRRALDNTPLYKAYAALQHAERKKEGKQGKLGVTTLINEVDDEMDTRDDGEVSQPKQTPKSRKQKQQQQHNTPKKAAPSPTAPFHNAFFYSYDGQNATTGAWHTHTRKDDISAEEKLDVNDNPAQRAARTQFSYYLLKPRVPGKASHTKAKELIPLSATDTLATALPGRSVLEFPTIYILPKDSALPAGHELGSTERQTFVFPQPQAPGANNNNNGKGKDKKANHFLKRRQDGKEDTSSAPAAKKRKTDGGEDDDGDEEDKDSEDADMDMEVIAAQLLESETSSSGSDSSDEEESESERDDEEEDDEDEDDFVEGKEEEPGFNGRLPELLHGLGSTGTLPADGKPKLVVYDSWSEGSDEE
ncbi:Box C/D snoRNA accumulation [Sporothrix stenoceras]|uniref:Box C/D snoRNA accumulation n=1 Tax=Sporothrix stenoceras TaxID=5173 RepID=A0ABR3Z9R6_9PEZI